MAPLPTKAARLVCALIASTALTSPALADGPRRGHTPQYKQHDRGHQGRPAGVLRINGERFRIDDLRSKRQIVRAFRDAGYHAWVDEGKVYAQYNWRHRPRVSWRSMKLDARVRHIDGCVVIKLYERRAAKYRPGPSCSIEPARPTRPARRGWSWSYGW